MDTFILLVWVACSWVIALMLPALIAEPLSLPSNLAIAAVHIALLPFWWVTWRLARKRPIHEMTRVVDRVHALEALFDSGVRFTWGRNHQNCVMTTRGGEMAVSFEPGDTILGTFKATGIEPHISLARLKAAPTRPGLWTMDSVTSKGDREIVWRASLGRELQNIGDVEAAAVIQALSKLDPAHDLVEDSTALRAIDLIAPSVKQEHPIVEPRHLMGTLAIWSVLCAMIGAFSSHNDSLGKLYFFFGRTGDAGTMVGFVIFAACFAFLVFSMGKDRVKPLALFRAMPNHAPAPIGRLLIDSNGLTLREGTSEKTIQWKRPFVADMTRGPSGARRVCLSVRQGTEEIVLSSTLPEAAIPKDIVLLEKRGVALPSGLFTEVAAEVRRFEAISGP